MKIVAAGWWLAACITLAGITGRIAAGVTLLLVGAALASWTYSEEDHDQT